MSTIITSIDPGSPAMRAGLQPGQQLISINGHTVVDVLDYRFYGYDPVSHLSLKNKDGSTQKLTIHKAEGEDLGLNFDSYLMDEMRSCANHCIFCFVDQMPPGMRQTLYFKDDDARLSFLQGNYITLTNLTEREAQRIIDLRISPINVSVHTTDPQLHCTMLGNKNAVRSLDYIRAFCKAGIVMNGQIVVCPGWNDGEILKKSLEDLETLRPAVQSIALVPIGLTKFRDGLPYIKPYNKQMAADLIESVKPYQERFLREIGTRLVFPADEFYCLSGLPLPTDEEYEDYPQIENGVGMLRMFETDLEYAVEDLPMEETPSRRICIATGTSVAPFLRELANKHAPRGTTVEVRPIVNKFFGESVTVTGLITGQDLVAQCQDVQADEILIVRSMIRAEGDLFLDNMSVDEVRAKLPCPLKITENSGEGFWRAISGQL